MHQTQFGAVRWGTSFVALLSVITLGLGANAQTVQIPVPPGQGKLIPAMPILGDVFGSSLDVDGQVLVAGGLGSVWVYENFGGIWMQQTRLMAPSASQNFGCSVAIDGDRIVVGDIGDDDVPVAARVFVFERSAGNWQLAAMLPDSNGRSAFDSFGSSLALHGDTVVAGSKFVGGSVGAAFIYNFDGAQWNEQAALLAPVPTLGSVFGSAVSVFGDQVAVGAPGDPTDQVVIYTRTGSNWAVSRVFGESDAGANVTPGSGFGSSVALGMSTIIVGLPTNGSLGSNSGSIAIFEDGGTGFEFDETCTATDVGPNDQFGVNVSLDGNRVLVGSPYEGVAGAAYLFTRAMGGLLEEAKFTPGDGQNGDRFGTSVAVSGGTVAFGSPFNSEGGSWVGAVYTLIQTAAPVLSSTFCFGDGGDQVGCTPCPCSNEGTVGTLGGCTNSSGTNGQLSIMGQASVVEDTLRLEVSHANPGTFGLLFSGAAILPNNPMNPCPAGSGVQSVALDGLRCIGVGVLRHGVRATDSNGDIGSTNSAWGLPDNPAGGLVASGAFMPGQTRYFQVNYREVGSLGCSTGLNTTNAAATLVAP